MARLQPVIRKNPKGTWEDWVSVLFIIPAGKRQTHPLGSNQAFNFFVVVCLFCFLEPHPRHMEIPRLGV